MRRPCSGWSICGSTTARRKNGSSEKEGAPQFEKLARAADADGNGLDAARAAQTARAKSTASGKPGQITLRGRIELRTEIEAHQLSDKTKALKDCANCHQQGAEPFQNVTVSIVGPDGKTLRYDAHKDVLSSVLSVDSLREFYAIGGTRNKVLDILLVLAVLGGLAVPIGHQTMKRLVARQTRERRSRPRAQPNDRRLKARPGAGDAPDGSDAPNRRRNKMQRIYVHPLPVRIWHWINALGFVAMILTGIQIRYIGLIDVCRSGPRSSCTTGSVLC